MAGDRGRDTAVSINSSNGHSTTEHTPLLSDASARPEAATTQHGHEHKLTALAATSIAGNDLASSVLYTAGVASFYASVWAPLTLLAITVMLHIFRHIYAEVVVALPTNGGTYTAMSNVTGKATASASGLLMVLSYTATAVVSASVSASYLGVVWPGGSDKILTPILILGFFAVLSIFGVKDSARVAILIFVTHLVVMVAAALNALYTAIDTDFSLLKENWHNRDAPLKDGSHGYPIALALLYGYASAALGVSGFESSSNLVSHLSPQAFLDTLRNLWWVVALLNPIMSFLSLCTVPIADIRGTQSEPNANLIAQMTSMPWLSKVVAVDAFLVLAGSVLTSFVACGELLNRLALDRVLPSALTRRNRIFGTTHWISIGFFLFTVALFAITNFNELLLAAIFALSFLALMGSFAVTCLVLKYKRSKLYRASKASVPSVIVALLMVVVAMIGNISLNHSVLPIFFLFFGALLVVVFLMLQRVRLLRMVLRFLVRQDDAGEERDKASFLTAAIDERGDEVVGLEAAERLPNGLRRRLALYVHKTICEIRSQACIFLLKTRDIRLANKAATYVIDNEGSCRLIFVRVAHPSEEDGDGAAALAAPAAGAAAAPPPGTASSATQFARSASLEFPWVEGIEGDEEAKGIYEDLQVLDRIYPKTRLEFLNLTTSLELDGHFIELLGRRLNVPPHLVFMSCPSQSFRYNIGQLGGVRLITH